MGLSIGLTIFRGLALGSLRTFKLRELMLLLGAVGIAGVVGGVCYYATDVLRVRGGWRRTLANVGSILVFGAVVVAVLLIALGGRAWDTH